MPLRVMTEDKRRICCAFSKIFGVSFDEAQEEIVHRVWSFYADKFKRVPSHSVFLVWVEELDENDWKYMFPELNTLFVWRM